MTSDDSQNPVRHMTAPPRPDQQQNPLAKDYPSIPFLGPQTEIKDTSKGARKNDKGKIMVDCCEPEFILGVGDIGTKGVEKYELDNWKGELELRRFYNAGMRHLLKYAMGEMIDPDSGQHHLLHAAWNLQALHWYYLHREGVDGKGRNTLNDPNRGKKNDETQTKSS